jgi:hypothetical protein
VDLGMPIRLCSPNVLGLFPVATQVCISAQRSRPLIERDRSAGASSGAVAPGIVADLKEPVWQDRDDLPGYLTGAL